jgi:hypothetical protein
MGEVSLHGVLLFLCLAFDGVELNPLPLYVSKARVLCAQSMDVGDDTSISEVEQGVVHHEAVVGGGVEDTQVGIS